MEAASRLGDTENRRKQGALIPQAATTDITPFKRALQAQLDRPSRSKKSVKEERQSRATSQDSMAGGQSFAVAASSLARIARAVMALVAARDMSQGVTSNV